jgi:outer membrane protein assembly factor BamE
MRLGVTEVRAIYRHLRRALLSCTAHICTARICTAHIAAIGSTALLAACSSYVPTIVSPYKVDVQQGNVVVREQIAQLTRGMTREQVRFLLGSPLLADTFHAQRWDYYYSYRKGGGATEQRKLTVHFDEANRLARWEGDEMPAEQPFAKREAGKTVVEIGRDGKEPAREERSKAIPVEPPRENAQ